MEQWKSKLKIRVEDMVYSRKIDNFNDVVAAFRERYKELTDDIEDFGSAPLLSETSSEDHAEFNIERYGLALTNDFEPGEIGVSYKEDEKSISIAVINVDGDFATVKSPDERNEYYLSSQVIDELFKKAYEPITN